MGAIIVAEIIIMLDTLDVHIVGDEVYYKHPMTNEWVKDIVKGVHIRPYKEIQYRFDHYAMMSKDVFREIPKL